MSPVFVRLVLIAAIIIQSTPAGAFFFFIFIPGSVTDALGDAITGAKGDNCVRTTVKVGDRVRAPDGSIHEVQQLSGTSPRCQNPDLPIRALLGPPIQITDVNQPSQTKLRMDLPVGWASVPLSSALRDRGFVFQAMNKTIDAGLLLSVAARKSITDPSEFAVTRRTSQVVALSDATYSDIHRTRVNGMNAWQFEVSGTSTLLRPGKQLTFEVTLVEGKKEIVEIKTWMYAAGIEGHKQELLNTARSIRGM